ETGAGLVLPDPPPETDHPTVQELAPAEAPSSQAPVTPPAPPPAEPAPIIETPHPEKLSPPRSTVEVMLPTHGCLDSGDTTLQMLSVLYENFANRPGAVNVTSAGFPALRRGRVFIFPERDSTQVLDARRFVTSP